MPASPLTELHRRQQLALRAATLRQVTALWPALDWNRLDDTYPALLASIGPLVYRQRELSALLAANYLEVFRRDAGVGEPLTIVEPPPLEVARLAKSLAVTSVASAKAAATRGILGERAMSTALVRTLGSVGRMVLDAGRETIVETVRADPVARGWQRVTSAKACSWCRMLEGRGAVYKEETSRFASHDHCGCTSEPVYRD